MKFAASKSSPSSFATFIITVVTVFIAGMMNIPVTDHYNPALAWVTAITLALWANKLAVLPGILIGYCTVAFLPLSHHHFIISFQAKLLLYVMTGLFMCVSAYTVIKSNKMSHSRYWILLIISLTILLWFSFQQPDIRISFVYFAAATITATLSGMKNMSTDGYPSMFYISLFSGYVPWMIGIRLLNLDLTASTHLIDFIQNYLLIPYAVYILLILIASHIVQSINTTKNSSFNN